ncbi:MAG: CoA synthetase [Hyphomicrobiaceae bacterium]|nr:CoA synthetase [Hyphomicrobiaceae bacterium]
MSGIRTEEIMIATIARMLSGLSHVAVGAASPVPGSAALLARRLSGGALRVSLLGRVSNPTFTDGARELFDCAAQGRIDAFFLSGVQIDGQANINLVSIGDPDKPKARFPGSFGSAYLYFLVPRVILFRQDHSPRALVPKVDYVSAPGVSEPNVYRPGGPYALVTGRCVFDFDKDAGRFRLGSVHSGHTVEEIEKETGFDFEMPDGAVVPETEMPSREWIDLIRGPVGEEIRETYPDFASRMFGKA